MTNILKVSMIDKIKALSELGWSSRKISRELGVHRDTVKKYQPIVVGLPGGAQVLIPCGSAGSFSATLKEVAACWA